MKKVSIINYGCGNYNSIIGMLKKFDCETIVTSSIKDLERSDIIILPGVGTFPHAMKMLKKNNLVNYIKKLKKIIKKKYLVFVWECKYLHLLPKKLYTLKD